MAKRLRHKEKSAYKDINIGVTIIFILVTLLFAFSFSQSSYGKKLLSHIPKLTKQNTMISVK